MAEHPIVHFDIHGTNRDELGKFYGDTFGWEIRPMPEHDFTLMAIGKDGVQDGGIVASDGDFTGTIIYISCNDIHDSVAKSVANGAEVIEPVTTMPGVVTYAMLKDPQGNRFGLLSATIPD